MAKYDFILDSIISVIIPECDLDQYSPKMNIDCATYAKNLAESFEEKQTQTILGQINDEEDNSSKTDNTPASTTTGRTLSGDAMTPPDKQGGLAAAKQLLSSDGSKNEAA